MTDQWQKAKELAAMSLAGMAGEAFLYFQVPPGHEEGNCRDCDSKRKFYRDSLDHALSAFAEAGYVLVPKEPTIEMIGAMADVNAKHGGMATPAQEYTAMITAALKDRT